MSLAARGDRILALTEGGRLLLIRVTPKEFDVLGEAKVVPGKKDWGWAQLAVADRELYVRDLTGVTAYRWK